MQNTLRFLLSAPCVAGFALATPATASPGNGHSAALETWLYDHFKRQAPSAYRVSEVRLQDDGGSQMLVLLEDPSFCGSGGCTLLVLGRGSVGMRLVSQITLARPPIRVLPTRHHDWHDLGVLVCGGGIRVCYEARLPFDGHSYATNPTMPPAEPLRTNTGVAVFDR